MTQPLNYTIKAIEGLSRLEQQASGANAAGLRYLIGKLRQAQIFVLPDCGVLLDRSKVRPDVPSEVFRPPFPVVAAEYPASPTSGRSTPGYTDERSSRRIALAWEWESDLPPSLRDNLVPVVPAGGVAIASIVYFDRLGEWLPVAAAARLDFDRAKEPSRNSAFLRAAVASKRIAPAQASEDTHVCDIIPLLPEAMLQTAAQIGAERVMDSINSDLLDEINAYIDLCFALGCRNVETQKIEQPFRLNRARIAGGRLPLKDFHVLKLFGVDAGGGGPAIGGQGLRAHLRRGHIRRLEHLAAGRLTWVNATMVRGHSYLDKVYAA